MLDLNLQLRRHADGSLILTLGLFFRLLFAAIAVVVAMGLLTPGTGSDGDDASTRDGVPWVPAVLLPLALFGALYEERWEVDRRQRTVESRHGLLFLFRRRRWQFESVAAVEYEHYRAGIVLGPPADESSEGEDPKTIGRRSILGGRTARRYIRYSLAMVDGRHVEVERRRLRNWPADRELPEALANTLGVPLRGPE